MKPPKKNCGRRSRPTKEMQEPKEFRNSVQGLFTQSLKVISWLTRSRFPTIGPEGTEWTLGGTTLRQSGGLMTVRAKPCFYITSTSEAKPNPPSILTALRHLELGYRALSIPLQEAEGKRMERSCLKTTAALASSYNWPTTESNPGCMPHGTACRPASSKYSTIWPNGSKNSGSTAEMKKGRS